MSDKAPGAFATSRHAGRAAAEIWRGLHGEIPATVRWWRKGSGSKPTIYRLTFQAPERASVFAKRSDKARLALERRVYEEILTRLPLTFPRYCGSGDEHDGPSWLFVEDVGNRRLSTRNPEHRTLAARWLGHLHRSGAEVCAGAGLPDAGPARYLAHLRSGREAIRRHFGNPGLTDDDRVALRRVLDHQDGLERRWGALEKVCEGMPSTLVHGDFRLKNVRIRVGDAATVLYPLDWEMAGWGPPAADLASAWAPGLTIPIDPRVYQAIVGERWQELDIDAVRRLATVGQLFQALAAINWASVSLKYESPRFLLKPVSQICLYVKQIDRALEGGAEWLD